MRWGIRPWPNIAVLITIGFLIDPTVSVDSCERRRNVVTSSDCRSRVDIDSYRSYDGSCNNVKFPTWGAAFTPMFRVVASAYDDGAALPRGFTKERTSVALPNVRDVTQRLMAANYTLINPYHTALLAHWGQLVAHDMTRARDSHAGKFCSATAKNGAGPARDSPLGAAGASRGSHSRKREQDIELCANIPLNDPYDRRRRRGFAELPFTRTEACLSHTFLGLIGGRGQNTSPRRRPTASADRGVREQLNTISAFIDASMVYGSDPETARALRDIGPPNLGMLKVNTRHSGPTGKPYLPFEDEMSDHPPTLSEPMECFRNKSVPDVSCFVGGDTRTSEQLVLVVLHTLLFREHNRIAGKLHEINPTWTGDRLYHEARKIIGGIIQHVTYSEWLPKIIGTSAVAAMNPYTGYQPFVNPSVANSFATAAMRFGHAIMVPVLERRNRDYTKSPGGHVTLRDSFFAPESFIEQGGTDHLMRGAMFGAVKEITGQSFISMELTEHLFAHQFQFGQDLASRNLQRGREHGVPRWNEFRKFCALEPVLTWAHFKQEVRDASNVDNVRQMYNSPENIDLWVGGLYERPLEGSKLGPTFTCLLADQFKRTRDGDRFWYENSNYFTDRQIQCIRRYSLSKLICNVADDIREIQHDPFEQNRILTPCEELPDIFLEDWRYEEPQVQKKQPPAEPEQISAPKIDVLCSTPDCRCQYLVGEWAPCDGDGYRARTDQLLTKSAGGQSQCPEYHTEIRSCYG